MIDSSFIGSEAPLVSVIVATYNRSGVLRWALESLLDSTLESWEAWIIGDACTDDTETAVASLGDARLSFVNLETNHGEQSRPNNEGARRARGRYLAFLNHDDLWMPKHLERCVEALEQRSLDLVYGLGLEVHHERPNRLTGANRDGRYRKNMFVPASSWVLRRELFQQIGPWRSYRDCYAAPSQNWLYRAHDSGALLGLLPEVTLVRFPSPSRPDSYLNSALYAVEQQRCLERLRTDPRFLEAELTRLARDYAMDQSEKPVWKLFRKAMVNAGYRTGFALGIPPATLRNALRFRRKGGIIDSLRRKRGLPRLG